MMSRVTQAIPDSSFGLYAEADFTRLTVEGNKSNLELEEYRSQFRRDYARVLHSPSFRRLAGKTQLYPGLESDFFRNRLTHSLEVAQIAKSIAVRINNRSTFSDGSPIDIDLDLIETAGIMHDIGHPPFGHQGEKALDDCMMNDGGFEGNAQTLRIISKLEKKFLVSPDKAPVGITAEGDDIRIGLNLCARTLASILKYGENIPVTLTERLQHAELTPAERRKIEPVKGVYNFDSSLIERIQRLVLRKPLKQGQEFKTVECQIMDIADDIAYSTYDLEDGLKAGFYHPVDIVFAKEQLIQNISAEVSKKMKRDVSGAEVKEVLLHIFKDSVFVEPSVQAVDQESFYGYHLIDMGAIYQRSKNQAKNGFARVALTSRLIGTFIRGINFKEDRDNPALSQVFLSEEIKLQVEILKKFNYLNMIMSPRLRIAAYRGEQIIKHLFKVLSAHEGYRLMPRDFQEIYSCSRQSSQKRVVCDYIAGMTDRYCIEFYGRLTSENPETIFKPF